MAEKRNRRGRNPEDRAKRTPTPVRQAVPRTGTSPRGVDPGDIKGINALVTGGRVAGYTVDSNGLVVKLDVSALSRIAFSVSADAPHFRPAVSMTMMALNNRINPATQEGSAHDQQYLWVKLQSKAGGGNITPAAAVGLSNSNEADPFDVAGFVFSPKS